VLRDGEDVELIIHDNTVGVFAEGEEEALVKSGLDLTEGFSAVPLMRVHDQ
jgi:hypothetical protein